MGTQTMTPQEREQLIRRLPYGPSPESKLRPDPLVVDAIVKWIDARQQQAVAAEREKIGVMAQKMVAEGASKQAIVAAIRART